MNSQRSVQEAAFLQNSGDYLRRAVVSAQNVLPHIFSLVRPSSVVDFGCGGGAWLSVCNEMGINDVIGLDGSYVDTKKLQFPEEHFLAHDLRQPLEITRRFDLAISLEVAEHIPAEASRIYIQSLVKLSPVILFSAAIPHQGGVGHVNEQWPSYWMELFHELNYRPIDCIRKIIWNTKEIDTWYKQNTILFAEAEFLNNNPLLRSEYESCRGLPMDLVHPDRYLAEADPNRIDVRKIPLDTAWKALKLQIRRRLISKLHWRIRRLLKT